ncbi:patatin-like phospholipase family protein [Microvirga sp. HBU67558]|uniref:patatin-like phospholipase family protein n=1 Tax=Microvirga TaxID=186650 RepID=UPI001B3775CC|nr:MULTISPECIES: patatin-like phospholipase family protein [unclassified Microvirga]MBQ0821925.1 patatin-like phospholipase family protein [Microvirga sp. HBU67558]
MKFAPDDYLAFFPLHHEVEDHLPLRLRSQRNSVASKPAAKKRRLSLALQGGGSFGAFTWGVLDRLLEDESITFDAVSGASAGAVNAVLLASGLAQGGPEAAKEILERFWRRASEAAPRGHAHAGLAMEVAVRHLSPYQFNPFNLHPLKTLLAEEVDFEALRQHSKLKLLVATTRVRDGRLRIFREKALTLDVILASTCLPVLHHAVTIDGEAYWDGGYSANPPLLPLVSASRATDALVVQIMPSVGAEMPTSASEIRKRIEQITFASSLARDMDALAAMKKLAGPHEQGSRLARKLQKLRLHHLTAEVEYPALSEASALNLDWDFLLALRDAGRKAADRLDRGV